MRTGSSHSSITMSLLQPFQLLVSNPTSIAVAGAATIVGLPFAQAAATGASATLALSIVNCAAFLGFNVATVSVPGRLDGQQDASMRQGNLNPNESTPLTTSSSNSGSSTAIYNAARDKSLVTPAGWVRFVVVFNFDD